MTKTAKKNFLEEIGNNRDFIRLFDHLDQLSFFLKNSEFEIVSANRNFYSRLGFTEERQIVGKNDYELFPKPLARKFRRDDQMVLKTGQEMPRMIELFLNRHGLPDWFITNKMPVHNLRGVAVGIMGTVQRYDQKKGLESTDPVIAKAVGQMLTNPGEIESVGSFARKLGMPFSPTARKTGKPSRKTRRWPIPRLSSFPGRRQRPIPTARMGSVSL